MGEALETHHSPSSPADPTVRHDVVVAELLADHPGNNNADICVYLWGEETGKGDLEREIKPEMGEESGKCIT